MKGNIRLFALFAALALAGTTSVNAAAESAPPTGKRVLFAHDENEPKLAAWEGYFTDELMAAGYEVEKVTAAEATGKDFSPYEYIVIHGAIMAFGSHSPVGDWLAKKPAFGGKKVTLFVTANRWSLDKVNKKINAALKKTDANVIDAVSSATKDLDEAGKRALVRDQVARLR
jgi:hypothetical protein